MSTGLRNMILAGCLGASLGGGGAMLAADADPAPTAPGREIPAPFAPFEYLIGSWKGPGIPAANRLKGWNETHAWAWKFVKGVPVGLSVETKGDKILTKAQLDYDPAKKTYTLTGADADGKAVVYTGALDKAGKTLTLDRVGTTSDGARQRITLTPNANFVRYTLRVAEQETGSPQFKPIIDVGVTKEGESFAAGGSAADLPKCIVTGGAATTTVSFNGKSYPICCSGCKDEFNDSPEKYIKKLALRSQAGAGKATVKTATSTRGKDDGTFAGEDVEEPKARPAPTARSAPAPKSAAPAPVAETPKDVPAAEPVKDADVSVAKAASLYRLGQNLEKTGKSAAALTYYRQVVKLYPDTPSAKTAAERIKALTSH